MEAPEGTPATYTNYWGYEIDLLYSIGGKVQLLRGILFSKICAVNLNFWFSHLFGLQLRT